MKFLICRKIQTSSPISAKLKKRNYLDPIYNYEELFASKFEFRDILTETAIFSENSKFHKI